MSATTAPATTTSADGTTIAYDRFGAGPPLVVVGGMFNTRHSPGPLLDLLAPHATVLAYDRRGRGDSGDAPPYATQREVEDLAAVLAAAGAPAVVYGHSSGAVLALEAAAQGLPIAHVVAYEPPLVGDDGVLRPAVDAHLAAGDREAAVLAFLRSASPMPEEHLAAFAGTPVFAGMAAIAHTIPNDLTITATAATPATLARIAVPVTCVAGADSPAALRDATAATAARVPGARHVVLDGQDHAVAPEAIAPLLVEVLSASPAALKR